MALGTGEVFGALVEEHAFTETGGVTSMRITQTYPSKDDRDGTVGSGMDEGMEACYLKLDEVLVQIGKQSRESPFLASQRNPSLRTVKSHAKVLHLRFNSSQ